MEDCKAIFTDIYERKAWGDGSGGGSAPDVARPYVDFVNQFLDIAPLSINRILDIGCGDGVVASMIDWSGYEYIGVDAAQGFDALTDPLPEADLVLCKEVLQHLSNAQVQLLLDRTAHYPRRLFTSMTGEGTNKDISCGGSRPVDLSQAPFYQNCRTVLTYGTTSTWIVQELTNP